MQYKLKIGKNMKKKYILLAAALFAAGMTAGAQTIDDALTFASSDNYGTARTIGMGNAVTAVGGDLGTATFNPAGAAVASYSQVSVTPGLSLSMTKGRFTDGPTKTAGGIAENNQARFIVPNVGITLAFDTHRDRGLKRVTFGYVLNASDYYNDAFRARREGFGSFTGKLALAADGTSPADLLAGNADALSCLAYKTNAINYLGENQYMGLAENLDNIRNLIYEPLIGQEYTRQSYGNKLEHILNLSFNISDVLYIGANLGLVSSDYTLKESINENDVKGVRYDYLFNNFSYRYNYNMRSTGIYGKFGVILTPFDGMRIGAAFQTPTAFNNKESWYHVIGTRRYIDDIAAASQNRSATTGSDSSSETGYWDYKVRTPLRFNVGLAYNIGRRLLVSADYERVDFKYTRYNAVAYQDEIYFEEFNKEIQGQMTGSNCLVAQNIVRAGAEIRVTDNFRIRAGYNFQDSGLGLSTTDGIQKVKADMHAMNFGLGLYTNRSFYCDIAARYTWRPDRTVQIYGDYDYVYKDPSSGTYVEASEAPIATAKRNLLTLAVTLGWRF